MANSASDCRFFTVKDCQRWAAEAYRAAAVDLNPPAGEPFVVDGVSWSSPGFFADNVRQQFASRLASAAQAAGVACDHGCATEQFWWDGGNSDRQQDASA